MNAAVSGSELNPATRRAALAALAAATADNPLDVLVVGGGVVGAGAAFDAVTRGLRVGLVEKRDLAAGTSSRSSRLAHGGLRYLEQGEFALVHEALTERGLLLDRIAPHLVQPVPFILPVARRWQVPYFGAGVELYDLLSRVGAYGGRMQRPKMLGREAARAVAPCLAPEALDGAVTFQDAQIDDARHVLALARSAAESGAAIGLGLEVVELLRFGDRVVGVRAREVDTGEELRIHAHAVIGATGVWTDAFRGLLGSGGSGPAVRQSKGVHLVVPGSAIRSSAAVITRTPASVLFMLPWGANWIIGTTDTDYEGGLDEPGVDSADIAYLLEQANRWLLKPLTEQDVVGTYSGLRPLVNQGGEAETTKLSREHAVLRPAPGLVQITGGKYTTYRVMARDAVDSALVERTAIITTPAEPCVTDQLAVVGGDGFDEVWKARTEVAAEYDLGIDSVEFLLRRHGSQVGEVLQLGAADRSLFERVHPGARYLRAEIVHAVTHEGARSVDDVLRRRTRLAMEVPERAVSVAEKVAELIGPELGWDRARRQEEVERYRAGAV